MTQEEVIKRLEDGNTRFVNDALENSLNDQKRRADLVGGQKPYAIVLSCADSRVVPELAFDTGLGEIFTVRVAGNVANPSSIASIEYAVANLGTNTIIVMGHESCGAVTAAVNGGNNGYNLNHLLAHISPAISAVGSDASIDDVVKKNAQLTAEDLKQRSPIIMEAVESSAVQIIPAYYHLEDGKVSWI